MIFKQWAGPRLLLMLSLLLTSLLISGCGDASTSTAGPVVSSQSITTVPTTLTKSGGTATVTVTITSGNLLNVTTSPPTVDVQDVNGNSIIGGKQPLISLNSQQNGWAYQFAVPATTSTSGTKTYRIYIYAQSINGNTGNTPYQAGSIIVPGN